MKTSCPHCHASYTLPDNVIGKAARCKKCGGTFKIAPAAPQAPLPATEESPFLAALESDLNRQADQPQQPAQPEPIAAQPRRRKPTRRSAPAASQAGLSQPASPSRGKQTSRAGLMKALRITCVVLTFAWPALALYALAAGPRSQLKKFEFLATVNVVKQLSKDSQKSKEDEAWEELMDHHIRTGPRKEREYWAEQRKVLKKMKSSSYIELIPAILWDVGLILAAIMAVRWLMGASLRGLVLPNGMLAASHILWIALAHWVLGTDFWKLFSHWQAALLVTLSLLPAVTLILAWKVPDRNAS